MARSRGLSGTNSVGGKPPPGFRSTQRWDTKENARILRAEVEAYRRKHGLPPIGPNDQVHHIVPSTSQYAEEARKLLDEYGIDINAADNGVVLRGGVPGQGHRYLFTVRPVP